MILKYRNKSKVFYFFLFSIFIAIGIISLWIKRNDGQVSNDFTPIEIVMPGEVHSYIKISDQIAPFLIIVFDPYCHLCHYEVKAILNNIEYFDGINIYMISPSELNDLESFINEYRLNNYPQIIPAHVNYEIIWKKFGNISPPSLFIYSKNGLLLYSSSGIVTPVGYVIDILRQDRN